MKGGISMNWKRQIYIALILILMLFLAETALIELQSVGLRT